MKLLSNKLPGKNEKVWFVIKESSHLGPYSFIELSRLETSGKISAHQPVWKVGLAQALFLKTLEKQYLKAQKHEGAAVVSVKLKKVSSGPKHSIDTPALPASPAKLEVKKTLMKEARTGKKVSYLFPVIGFILAGSIGMGLWFFTQSIPQIYRGNKVAAQLFKLMESTYQRLGRDELALKVFPAKDLSELYILSSTNQVCHYQASFRSKKILSQNSIHFKASARALGGVVTLGRFNFSQGEKFIPGYYQVEIKKEKCRASFPIIAESLANKSYQFETLIYSGSEKKFASTYDKFEKWQEKKFRLKNKVILSILDDMEQRYSTLEAMTNQIEIFFKDGLHKHQVKKTVGDYTKSFGSFLTNFVVQNEEMMAKVMALEIKEKKNISKHSKRVNQIARNIGFKSMKFIEEIKKENQDQLHNKLNELNIGFEQERQKLEASMKALKNLYPQI